MKRFLIIVPISLVLGLGVTLALLQFLGQSSLVLAANGTLYVALDGADTFDCSDIEIPCRSVQRAVDVAVAGDVIKVAAGVYTDVQARPSASGYNGSPVVTQVVYISTAVTIRGGYTTTNGFADPPTGVSALAPQGQGRGVYVAPGVTVTLEGLQLVAGNASGYGGGGAPNHQDAGGGLYADRAATIITDCLFANNSSESAGGLFINSGAFILQNSVITTNIATASNGGGLYIQSLLTGTISHNSLLSNTAASSGGGLYMAYGQSDIQFSDNDFIDNKAGGDGGGIFWASESMLVNNQVMSNKAGNNGGGLYVKGNFSLIESNRFIGNDTANYGGGVYISRDTAVFRANNVISNTSGKDGGGLLLILSEGLFENNVVAQNRVGDGESGSGIYIWGGTPRLIHTTIAQNIGGDRNGVYLRNYSGGTEPEPGHAILTNTILVSQSIGFYAESDNTAVINGVLWYGNTTANVGGSGTVTVSHAYTGSPAFVNSDGWDYHINVASAAKNKGVSTSLEYDIDGDLRLGVPDLGADEYVRHIYLPVILR